MIRRILNVAAGEWIDENGLTWLVNAPKIKLLPEYDNREPETLNRIEEAKLIEHLPQHLKDMALYALNTGSRLRAAGVSFEDRQDLLGHTSSRMTTHYSPSEIANLVAAANKAVYTETYSPTINLVKRDAQLVFHKTPTRTICEQMKK